MTRARKMLSLATGVALAAAALVAGRSAVPASAHPQILWGLPDVSVSINAFDRVNCGGIDCVALHSANGLPPDGDRITLTSQPLASIPANQVEICLGTAASVTWWKNLKVQDAPGFAEYNGAIYADLQTQDSNHGTVCQRVSTFTLSHAFLVFGKAKLFGIHTDMFFVREHLNGSGGTRLTFTWNAD